MLKPGAIIYYFINRRNPEFISIHTHARPISGQMVENDGDKLVVGNGDQHQGDHDDRCDEQFDIA